MNNEIKKIKRKLIVLAVCNIVSFVCIISMVISDFVISNRKQKREQKMIECNDNSMCIKLLDNGEFECVDCQ